MADMNGKGLRAAIDDPRRAVNVERLTEQFLGRIEAWQERCNPFITVDGTVARGDAAASQEALDHNRVLGPAHGSVVAVKDDIDVAGMACTVGNGVVPNAHTGRGCGGGEAATAKRRDHHWENWPARMGIWSHL